MNTLKELMAKWSAPQVELPLQDLPELGRWSKDLNPLDRVAAHLFRITDGVVVRRASGGLWMIGPTAARRQHAFAHLVAVGWARVQPMDGCSACADEPQSPLAWEAVK